MCTRPAALIVFMPNTYDSYLNHVLALQFVPIVNLFFLKLICYTLCYEILLLLLLLRQMVAYKLMKHFKTRRGGKYV